MPKLVLFDWLVPDWPAPERVRACVTTRQGGTSRAPYDSMNMGIHVGDNPAVVEENRNRLIAMLELPSVPLWLNQVHGCTVVEVGAAPAGSEADASVSRTPGQVCAVMSADCLPLLLCDQAGSCVAAVHAGWRGLADGVIDSALDSMRIPVREIVAWLGPAIGPDSFVVGDEVRRHFIKEHSQAEVGFSPGGEGWLADIYTLARLRLRRRGVVAIYGGGYCTFRDKARFFSYRRDGRTGRMVSLIWLV